MNWIDPKQWLLIALFCAAALVGVKFWEGRLIAEGRHLEQADNAKRLIVENAKAQEKTAAWQKGKDDALIEANKRAQALKDLADKLAATNRGLRDELTGQRNKLSTASLAAVRQYATAANSVFGECSAEVERLAGEAGGHSSDSLMLQQAWPK